MLNLQKELENDVLLYIRSEFQKDDVVSAVDRKRRKCPCLFTFVWVRGLAEFEDLAEASLAESSVPKHGK